ncbi:MAG: hypothetical protein IJQ87_05810 [Clostridia bacterium]|nr:hypothetical protein [Clostridia bacterium]MBQ6922121.1 hypothetical protein [Clostridia bacterium]
MENKKEFTDSYLKPLLCNARLGVIDAVYKRSIRREIVVVTFDGGYKKNIDVTADSLAALATDVIKQCN